MADEKKGEIVKVFAIKESDMEKSPDFYLILS